MKKFVSLFLLMGILSGCSGGNSGGENGVAEKVQEKYEWKMAMTWPKNLPGLGKGAIELADRVEEMSGGRLKIKVYGAGELFPALELFDQVKKGTVEMGHAAAYYWVGKEPVAQMFTALPFGMSAQQMNAWLYEGGGLELWEEVYAKHGLVPMPAGNTGVQMGGWFNKEITSVEDLKGLKMRIPGMAGKAFSDVGGSAENIPAGELYQSLEKGTIDALEWVGPWNDSVMGFSDIAKYYYFPGWHERGPTLELTINKEAWDALPLDLQAIVRAAAAEANVKMLSAYEKNNAEKLLEFEEKGIELKEFPKDVVVAFRVSTEKLLEEKSAANAEFKKVYESYKNFQEMMEPWYEVSERAAGEL